MHVALVQELPADGLARAAFEQHVVRHHHGGAAVLLEQRLDVLHEVELLVGRGGPEVVALDDVLLRALPSSPTIVVLLFLPNGGLVSTMSKRSPGSAASASADHRWARSCREPMPCSNRFIAHSRAVPCTSSQPLKAPSLRWRFSSLVRLGLCLHDVVVRGEEKAAGAAGRVADRLAGLGRDARPPWPGSAGAA